MMNNEELILRKLNSRVLIGGKLKQKEEEKLELINNKINNNIDKSTDITNELFYDNEKIKDLESFYRDTYSAKTISKTTLFILIIILGIINAHNVLLFLSLSFTSIISINIINKIINKKIKSKLEKYDLDKKKEIDIENEFTITKEKVDEKKQILKEKLKVIDENKNNRMFTQNRINQIDNIINIINNQFEEITLNSKKTLDDEIIFSKDIQKVLKKIKNTWNKIIFIIY